MKKRVLPLLLAAIFAVGVLSSCGGADDNSATAPLQNDEARDGQAGGDDEGSQADTQTGSEMADKDTMVIGCYGEPQSMFPANDGKIPGVHLVVNLYETLFTMDYDGNVIPLLAESYEQVDDVTYRINLKQGVQFHNGDEMKASDVIFTMKHVYENPVTAVMAASFDPDSFEIEDDYTVILRTTEPFAMFLRTLCHAQFSIFSEAYYNDNQDIIDLVPVGTGPFQFVEWNEGNNIILERFEDYHGDKAIMKTLNFRYIPEANSRTLELETGGIDLMTEVPGITLDQIRDNGELILWERESVGLSFLALNFDKEILSIPEVRQAIAYAIDNDTLRKTCLMEAAVTAYGYLPESVPGAKLDLPRYDRDVEYAKELLAQAGYPDGISLSLAFYQSADNRRMGEVLQAMLKEAGIELDLNEMETAVYTPFLNSREQFAAITTLNNTLRDPHHTLSKLYSEACGVGGNRVNYNNPEMDALLDAAAGEIDWDKRVALYDEIQQKLFDDTVWIPLYSLKVCTATTAKIRGFDLIYPASYQRYDTVYFVD